jgi:hypothetical protein
MPVIEDSIRQVERKRALTFDASFEAAADGA